MTATLSSRGDGHRHGCVTVDLSVGYQGLCWLNTLIVGSNEQTHRRIIQQRDHQAAIAENRGAAQEKHHAGKSEGRTTKARHGILQWVPMRNGESGHF